MRLNKKCIRAKIPFFTFFCLKYEPCLINTNLHTIAYLEEHQKLIFLNALLRSIKAKFAQKE